MKEKLENKLYNKYPSLFIQKDLPYTDTCMNMGIATGDGWYDILDKMCAKIIELDIHKEVQFTQVKEKFGGLRVYFIIVKDDIEFHAGFNLELEDVWSKIYDIIDNAEDESYNICEDCGKPGSRFNSNFWIRTLCKKCKGDMKNE